MTRKAAIPTLFLVLAQACLPAPFDTPESALYDPDRDVYYVSNIAGDSTEADGIGWISLLNGEGQVLHPRWVDGLNAPKGMALVEGKLYVADLNEIVEIDPRSARITQRVLIPDALFLNDLTGGDGRVWASDTFGSAIYELSVDDGSVHELARGPELASINGLLYDEGRLLGATIGDFMDYSDLGDLVEIDLNGGVTVLVPEIGKIDGIVRDGQDLLATDFRGSLLRVDSDLRVSVEQDLVASHGVASAADLGFDPIRRRAAVPDLFGSQVVFVDLEGR